MNSEKRVFTVDRITFFSSQSVVWIFIAILMGDALGGESPISRWLYFGIALLMSGCYTVMTVLSAVNKRERVPQ